MTPLNENVIWELIEPVATVFAQCWLRSPSVLVDRPCSKCTNAARYRWPEPLICEWESGSDLVGDFVWPGGGRVAVQQHVFAALTTHSSGLRSGVVEMVQDPKLKRSARGNRKKPRVWLPYEGPPLVELVVQRQVELLPETTTEVVHTCPVCGAERRLLVGAEIKKQRWDNVLARLVPVHEPRAPGQGIIVSKISMPAEQIFRVNMFNHAILCTSSVRDCILNAGFTNIDFLEVGEFR